MSRLRALIGPTLVGVAVWCAAGELTVRSQDSAVLRVFVPASWWWLAAGLLSALAVRGFRRDPRVALLAMVSTLPWWPVPLPPIALLWTGPLAWVPIALAVFAALGTRDTTEATPAPDSRPPAKPMRIAGALTFAVGVMAAIVVAPHVPGGDEPHYLIITQSLIKDGDLQIRNNHDRRDYAAYFPGNLTVDKLANGKNGKAYSIHAPGVAVLVLPAFWLLGIRGAEVTFLLVAAITGALIWNIAWRTTRDSRAAWFAWAAITGSCTFVLQSFMIYPDAPGALCVALAVWLMLRLAEERDRVGILPIALTSLALAALPWLHTRFSPLAGGFGLVIGWQLFRDMSRPVAGRVMRLIAFALVPLVSALGWFAFFQIIYGTPDPRAPYGPTDGPDGQHAVYAPGGLMGLLFDQEFGLIAYAPVLAAAAFGFARIAAAEVRRAAYGALAVLGLYTIVAASYWMWWAGVPATPARLATAVLPALAIPLSAAWARPRPGMRPMLAVLLGASLAVSFFVLVIGRGDLAWSSHTAEAQWLDWLGPVVNLPRGWPSFFWKLTPARASTEWPFALHAVVTLAVFVGTWLIVTALGRRRGWNAPSWKPAAAGWFMASLMAATQAGWWLNTSVGLDASRSQLQLLEDVRRGRPAYSLRSFALRREPSANRLFTIRGEETGPGTNAWAILADVAPGTYEVRVHSVKPRRGILTVTIGQSPSPFRTLQLDALTDQVFTLVLPAGAVRLTMAPDADLLVLGGRVELQQVELLMSGTPAKGRSELAQSSLRLGAAEVFFLDDGAFVETDGFWVRGHHSAQFALAGETAVASFSVTNGDAPNAVMFEAGSFLQTISLQPSESRQISLPMGVGHLSHVRITSKSGFRPSDKAGSTDSRNLGVWIGK